MDKDVNTGETQLVKMIVFAVGEQEYCIPILSVREIRGLEKTTPLPFAPPYVCGAINLRGIILTVINLATYLNVAPEPENPRRVVVIIEACDGTVCGLLVDRVIDMADIKPSDIQVVAEKGHSLSGLVMIGERMIGVLKLDVIAHELINGMQAE